MLRGLGNALRVYLERNIVFVYPARPTTEPEVLRGHAVVALRKAMRVSLVVRLIGTATVDGRSSVVLDCRVEIADHELAAGDNVVEFALTVPQDSATYELCPHGKVRRNTLSQTDTADLAPRRSRRGWTRHARHRSDGLVRP